MWQMADDTEMTSLAHGPTNTRTKKFTGQIIYYQLAEHNQQATTDASAAVTQIQSMHVGPTT